MGETSGKSPLKGLMQDWPLLVSKILIHAASFHPRVEVVSQTVEGGRHRYTYAECEERCRKLAQALKSLKIKPGERVATLAWNTYRHLELWYGVSGYGAVCHTLNPRLFPKDIAYIVNHAEDAALFFDLTFLPLVQKLKSELKSVKHFVVMTDRKNMPKSGGKDLLCYEELVEKEDGKFAWPEFGEETAAMLCYTSGTTGHPKGVLYPHRSTVLHAMAIIQPDAFNMSAMHPAMPVVPMFHANAWGYPHGAPMVGAKLVLNGPAFEGKALHTLIREEGVMLTAAVPTIWLGLLKYLKESGETLEPLEGLGIGGAAAPPSMIEAFEKKYGVKVHHAWGMTEMSPVGSMGSPTAEVAGWPADEQLKLKRKQGRGLFGVEMRLVDDDGEVCPWDGGTAGHLRVKGPWTAKAYYRLNKPALDDDGWFDTGDVATIDENGYMQITDRAKDVIKSGGEWISSIELENAAMGHEDVDEAAVIGLPHKKWGERPLMVVVPDKGRKIDKKKLLAYLGQHVAKWWLPDDIVEIGEMPHTATGKVQKTELREKYKDHQLPETASGPEEDK